jgi:hypothetical protein
MLTTDRFSSHNIACSNRLISFLPKRTMSRAYNCGSHFDGCSGIVCYAQDVCNRQYFDSESARYSGQAGANRPDV